MPFFRYPGRNAQFKEHMLSLLAQRDYKKREYRELFFGSSDFIRDVPLKNIWINSLNFPVFCLWNSLLYLAEDLKKRVRKYNPTADFDKYNRILMDAQAEGMEKRAWKLKGSDRLDIGFAELVLRSTFNGRGAMAGEPLNTENICAEIDKCTHFFIPLRVRHFSFTSFDNLIEDESREAVLFLDPPYYKREGEHEEACGEFNHRRLVELLKATKHKWILSYDDCKEIREMYSWAAAILPVKASKNEAIISNDPMLLLVTPLSPISHKEKNAAVMLGKRGGRPSGDGKGKKKIVTSVVNDEVKKAAAMLGRRGGIVGGHSKSEKKIEAAMKNINKMRRPKKTIPPV